MKFEVGNKVYCNYHKATGTITDIKNTETYSIYVTFEDGNTDTYKKSGKRLESGNPVLSKVTEQATTTEPNSEIIPGLGKVFTLSCGTRVLKTLENTYIILFQNDDL